MAEIKKFEQIPYSTETLFELVAHVEQYPEFLPWCKKVTLNTQDQNRVTATLEGTKLGMNFAVTITYLLRPYHMIEIRPNVSGPFRKFLGLWRFSEIPGDATHSKFGIELQMEFTNIGLAWTLTPLIRNEVNNILKAFIDRAARNKAQ